MMNTIACLLETAAKRWPQNIALEDNDGEMTYAELRRLSRKAASFFLKKGLKRGQPVAVYLPKSNAYYNEIRYFVDCVLAGKPCEKVKAEELHTVLELIEKLG